MKCQCDVCKHSRGEITTEEALMRAEEYLMKCNHWLKRNKHLKNSDYTKQEYMLSRKKTKNHIKFLKKNK